MICTMSSQKLKVGIVGCGNVSDKYMQAASLFDSFEIVACADLDPGRAQELAGRSGIPRALTIEQLLGDSEIDLVLNLTTPAVHGTVALEALRSGKHVYGEQPLAQKRREAREMIGIARQKNLRIGCAPDTFLGAGLQTCRALIDQGAIGEPVGGTAFILGPGVESWHPDPSSFYKKGGGPLFDMGPFYLTALTTLIGPVRRVCASARISFPERQISSQPLAGQKIQVETPTHIAVILDMESGPIITLTASFDVQAHTMPAIEIYGTEATLSLPDPHTFGGTPRIRRLGESDWTKIPLRPGYADESRGLGLADLAAAVRDGREHRANAHTAYHVLDVMHSALDSSESERHIEITSSMTRPAPLREGLAPGCFE